MSQWVIDNLDDAELDIIAELGINAELGGLDDAQSEEEQSRKMQSIYKVPPLISDLNKNAYRLQAVSFGPYHHGDPHLMPMEVYKLRALRYFLRRSETTRDEIFNSMVEVADELKGSYASLESEWQNNTEKFVNLMIVDGCFMLEIFWTADLSLAGLYWGVESLFRHDGIQYVIPFIKRDILLLENQLPMRVLLVLLKFCEYKDDMESLKWDILSFYNCNINVDYEIDKCLHVLDFYHKSLLYKRSTPPEPSVWGLESFTVILSATKLKEAGIRFKQKHSGGINNIAFDRGVLWLPRLEVDNNTESTFLNLIAFEWCHGGVGHEIMSFICFMDRIVDHDRDIALLSSKGIIHNVTGSNKATADLFNNMSNGLMMDPTSNLNMVTLKMDFYCKKRWNKWLAMLRETHFRSPWTIVSIVAAIIFFALTTLQTLFSGYDATHK